MALFGAGSVPAKPKPPEIDINALREEIQRLKLESEISRKYGPNLTASQMDFYKQQMAHDKAVAEKKARNAVIEKSDRERIAQETEQTFRELIAAPWIVVHSNHRRATFTPDGDVACPNCGGTLQNSSDHLRMMAASVRGTMNDQYRIFETYPAALFGVYPCRNCKQTFGVYVQVVPGGST